MTLSAGTKLGPYEILTQLGAGGMGEVYRARDTRLGRDVAVKVLPDRFSGDPEALARFEQEARAVAALSHPNILAIHDFGRHEDMAYAVMELLEGETLRERMRQGRLSVQKTVDYATQIALGLAAAHDRGIVHRDLKPENLFVTTSGLVKILDFGLARRTPAPTGPDDTSSHTVTQLTEAGTVLGTAGYMSPEQVRAEAVDHRSDVFSFGCVLHEMLAGRRTFQRQTNADTLAAILREEPETLETLRPEIPHLLQRLVAHCLEKNPGERFQSMRDVAFDLKALAFTPARSETVVHALPRATTRQRVWILASLAAAALAGFALHAFLSRTEPLRLHKLTFQRGTIYSARFAPDGQTLVFGANWSGRGIQLYSTRLDATESRPLGIAADVLGISKSGEMAISLERKTMISLLSTGRLARAPLAGGAPREMLDGVVDADWSSDGRDLAITRQVGSEAVLEYPIGKVLHRMAGYLSSPRISPRGDVVAFIQHPVKGDDRGTVGIADQSGRTRTLTPDMPSVTGLDWSPDGKEIWFSAWLGNEGFSIEAITTSGRRRTVARPGVRVRLFDVLGPRALVGYESGGSGTSGQLHGDAAERDLSWLDGTCATDISTSGDRVLFIEAWEGGGSNYSFFLRKAGGSDPVRLGEGWGASLSADGRWVLGYPTHPPMRLTITPTGPGEPRNIDLHGIEAVGGASWFPGEHRILLWASETGQPFRGYIVELPAGSRSAVTPAGVAAGLFTSASHALSPDGRRIAATDGDGNLRLYPVEGGEPETVPGWMPGEEPVAWSGDGRTLYVRKRAELPSRVYRLDLESGKRELWKELMPADPAGVIEILGVVLTPDARFYAYSYLSASTDLYVVEGLR